MIKEKSENLRFKNQLRDYKLIIKKEYEFISKIMDLKQP
jgi:hypothetical protein